MFTYDTLIFDLDGTISDPAEGIVKSMNYALQRHGFPSRGEDEITAWIGPPLDQAFTGLTGVEDGGQLASLVASYRERYAERGYRENLLYPGIKQALEALTVGGKMQLGVCTSKRRDFAEEILKFFGLSKFFAFVDGGDVGIEKRRQLQKLLAERRITENSLMIGDRSVDLTAAHANGLDSAGVLWGYGSRLELEREQPKYLFDRVGALLEGLLG